MQVGILGPLEVRAAGTAVALRGARMRTLLARLALDAGRTVPVSALADALWPTRTDARHALHSLMTRLRDALPAPEAVRTLPGGYRLDLPPDAVDAVRFEQLARAGRDALRTGRSAGAVEHLRAALELWRGDALADLPDVPFAVAAAARLDELRRTAREDRAEAELRTGADPAGVVAELHALTSAHPTRERAHALLLRALHADGRTAEALDHYARLRTALADRLGADPSPELRAAHLAVLRPERPRPRLPVPLTSFVGREAELALIAGRLADHRLVTLTGPGGAGKTRLAVAAGTDRAGGAVLVELAGLRDPDGVGPAARAALGTTAADVLLVLDNAEHLLDPVAAVVEELLHRHPGLRVLVTSREPLGTAGEALVPVPPLPVPPAGAPLAELAASPSVRLFADRAAAANPAFALTPTSTAGVAELCRRLDGLPLAIELAAARARSVPVEHLATVLDDRFAVLTTGARTAPPRHRTLAAVVAWSWDLLDDDERALVEALSAFPGTITPTAAEHVGRPSAPVRALLAALVDKSLLQPAAGAEVRYRMLETIREYGAHRLADRAHAARAAHARYFLQTAEAAVPELRGPDQLRRLPALLADRENLLGALRFAVDAGDVDTAVRLASAMSFPLTLHGDHTEAARLLRAALDLPGAASARGYSAAVAGYFLNSLLAGTTPAGLDRFRPAAGTDHPSAYAIGPLLAALSGDSGGAELPATPPSRTTPWGRALYWLLRALVRDHGGDLRRSADDLATAADRFAAVGERWGLATALTRLAAARLRLGDPDGAIDALRRARAPAAELGRDDRQRIWLATAHEHAGEPGAALAELAAVLAGAPAPHDIAQAHLRRGDLHRRGGDLAAADREYTDAERAAALNGEPGRPFRSAHHTARAHLSLARAAAAAPAERAALLVAAATDLRAALDAAPDHAALADTGVAGAALHRARGEPVAAAATLGAAHRIRGAADPLHPDVVALTRDLRRAMGEGFDTAYDRARRLDGPAATALLTRAVAPTR
ncbi:BTAD domain-containing putative transcriptional regulator [Pseudonocardia humida]|uniref:Winged helix-turn-helix domain-containing protein n=1 Tax=Pseudonocardia humida TaxID=2800819 RepID=A0ABT1A466_9PSEU|nr:BTAD domain-containing putative transcriptional regulator [Pseudonocardia humida]MCO1657792.1 winged helix-turn-helix domain-containing protein [Pseudonocardia humida]